MKRKKKNKPVSDSEILQFTELLTKLEPIEFLGVANILQVELLNVVQNCTPRPFEEIFSDMLDKYITLSVGPRKEILNVMRQSIKTKMPK